MCHVRSRVERQTGALFPTRFSIRKVDSRGSPTFPLYMPMESSRSVYPHDAVLQRRLRSLSCPSYDSVSVDDPASLQQAVCWLEDTIIRRRQISARDSLRSRTMFIRALARYLAELRAPPQLVDSDDAPAALMWLVRFALAERFADDPQRFNEPIDPWAGRSVPTVCGAANDERLAATAQRMVHDVRVADVPVPCTDAALRGLAALVEARLTSFQATPPPGEDVTSSVMDVDSGDVLNKSLDENISVPRMLVLEQLPLGFATSDEAVDRVAKVLRLLYVRKLRRLQNHINEAIATMQRTTADPKTDSRLGQVGR